MHIHCRNTLCNWSRGVCFLCCTLFFKIFEYFCWLVHHFGTDSDEFRKKNPSKCLRDFVRINLDKLLCASKSFLFYAFGVLALQYFVSLQQFGFKIFQSLCGIIYARDFQVFQKILKFTAINFETI